MIAPNGARKSKKDHPKLPISISEIVKCAISCKKQGADAIHAHVRNKRGEHVLDAGLYRELIDELAIRLPDMLVQITTESLGRYSPAEQCEIVEQVKPKAVSVALREMLSDKNEKRQRKFYWSAYENQIELQHIIYSPEEILYLDSLIREKIIPDKNISILFVLGRYKKKMDASPKDLIPFIKELEKTKFSKRAKIMLCAFGQNEQNCLIEGVKLGFDCRIGFENNHLTQNGKMAVSNGEQVANLVLAINKLNMDIYNR